MSAPEEQLVVFKRSGVFPLSPHVCIGTADCPSYAVLDAGRIRAFAEPLVLLQDPDGIFFKMVQQTGKQEAAALHEAAKQAFNSSQRPAGLTNGHAETVDGHLVIFETAL